jgi:gamma-glutamyltranspeptidase
MVLPGVTSTAGVAGYLVALPGREPTYVHGPYRRVASERRADQLLLPGAALALLEGQARFGKLPLVEVMAPVIRVAREGFPIDALFARSLRAREPILRASPYAARTFFPRGTPLTDGEWLALPELAVTLGRVAKSGAAEITRGEWARALLEDARARGLMPDATVLASLHAELRAPLRARYRGRTVLVSSGSSFGGKKLLLGLALLAHADLGKLGAPDRSAASLALYARTHRAIEAEPWIYDDTLPNAEVEERIASRADALWPSVRDGSSAAPPVGTGGEHSSAVIVVDKDGGVVVGTHTIENLNWGPAWFVGGIPVNVDGPTVPGNAAQLRAPDPLSAAIVFENDTPRVALTVYGTGLHPADLQVLTGILDFGRDPETAVLAPRLGWFAFDITTMTTDKSRNLLDLRVDPALRCRLGALGETFIQHEEPGYPPGHLDLGFPTVVELRGAGPTRELLGMTPEWMDGVAEGD